MGGQNTTRSRGVNVIESQRRWWADAVFRPYLTYLMRRHFRGIYCWKEPLEINDDYPILLVPNHTTWWDGFLVYLLNDRFTRREIYMMMLEEQLARYWFFRFLGAFSIRPGNPGEIRKSLNYAATLLAEKNQSPTLLCIFPQGELQPLNERPLDFRRGIELVMKLYGDPVNLLPLGLYAGFFHSRRPEVYCRFGENHIMEWTQFPGVSWLEDEVTQLLQALEASAGSAAMNWMSVLSSRNNPLKRLLPWENPDGEGT